MIKKQLNLGYSRRISEKPGLGCRQFYEPILLVLYKDESISLIRQQNQYLFQIKDTYFKHMSINCS